MRQGGSHSTSFTLDEEGKGKYGKRPRFEGLSGPGDGEVAVSATDKFVNFQSGASEPATEHLRDRDHGGNALVGFY